MKTCRKCNSELVGGCASTFDEFRYCLKCVSQASVETVTKLQFNQSAEIHNLPLYRRKLTCIGIASVLIPTTAVACVVGSPLQAAITAVFILLIFGPIMLFIAHQWSTQESQELPRCVRITLNCVEIESANVCDSFQKDQCRIYLGKSTQDTLGIRHDDQTSVVLEIPSPCRSWNQHLRGHRRQRAFLPWKRYRIALGSDPSFEWLNAFWQLDDNQSQKITYPLS